MAKTFRNRDDRIKELLARPGMAEAVEELQESAEAEERTYAMSLAMIREASNLTQTELARRLNVTQGSVSRLESRGDVLLSTLQAYLEAAGATHSRIVVTVNGGDVEIDLDQVIRNPTARAVTN